MYVVTDILAGAAREYPARPAAADSGGEISYGELWESARARAAQLAAMGVERGDRVAILLPPGSAALGCFFGTQLPGAVAVFIDHRLKSPQVAHRLSDSGARVVAASSRYLSLLPPRWPPAAVLSALLPVPGGPKAPPDVPVIGRHLAALMYTSGSTGPPKGVMLTQANLLCGARIVAGCPDGQPELSLLGTRRAGAVVAAERTHRADQVPFEGRPCLFRGGLGIGGDERVQHERDVPGPVGTSRPKRLPVDGDLPGQIRQALVLHSDE